LPSKVDLAIPKDHVSGGFHWDKKPQCKCGRLEKAFEEKFFFASNVADDGLTIVYMHPVDSDGYLVRSKGVEVAYCPWCGDKIKVHKKYK
jgi:hypothetical protein